MVDWGVEVRDRQIDARQINLLGRVSRTNVNGVCSACSFLGDIRVVLKIREGVA
jgi:hypothetical protein